MVFLPAAESCFPFEETFPIRPYRGQRFSIDLLASREWDALWSVRCEDLVIGK